MRDEQHQSPPFTLEAVTRIAQGILLERGSHTPTVIVEGDQRRIGVQLDSPAPTHEGRAQQMFRIGLALAQSGEVGVLQQVFFISEAWLSSAAPGERFKQLPSQDPQRKEVVMIAHRVLRPPSDEVVVFELKRDAQGVVTDFEALPQHDGSEDRDVRSPLITAFVIGFLGSASTADD